MKRPRTEAEFNLTALRQWLRLGRRLIRKMEAAERSLAKAAAWDRKASKLDGRPCACRGELHVWDPAAGCPPEAPRNRRPQRLRA